MKARKRFYVHPIQRKYALFTCLLLLAYTFVLAVALFLPPALRLRSGLSLEEQALAATQFIALSDRLWPAILVSVPVFMLLSIWVTHRFAGPIYRLEQSLKQIASGDLRLQVHFRAGDDLQELAVWVNEIVRQKEDVLRTVQSVHHLLVEILGEVRNKRFAPEQLDPMLDQIQKQAEGIEALLQRFTLGRSLPSSEPPESVPHRDS
ncbi:MAG TPA: methyl-accepting chemotaxis protein [Nitrospiria bacterium]|nr:methyl-accepting chemotaxis protein [Nitrospiria bacterium]